MFEDLNDLYQQVILDHSRSPRNFKKLDGANRIARGHNPLCGDRITIYLHLDGDVISDISFEGSVCAISKASASVMTTIQYWPAAAGRRKGIVWSKYWPLFSVPLNMYSPSNVSPPIAASPNMGCAGSV